MVISMETTDCLTQRLLQVAFGFAVKVVHQGT